VPVILHPSNIAGISTIQMNIPHNLNSSENLRSVELMYFELMKRFENGDKLPLLDPKEDMEIDEQILDDYLEAKKKIEKEV
jgi:hypothetical protein